MGRSRSAVAPEQELFFFSSFFLFSEQDLREQKVSDLSLDYYSALILNFS